MILDYILGFPYWISLEENYFKLCMDWVFREFQCSLAIFCLLPSSDHRLEETPVAYVILYIAHIATSRVKGNWRRKRQKEGRIYFLSWSYIKAHEYHMSQRILFTISGPLAQRQNHCFARRGLRFNLRHR